MTRIVSRARRPIGDNDPGHIDDRPSAEPARGEHSPGTPRGLDAALGSVSRDHRSWTFDPGSGVPRPAVPELLADDSPVRAHRIDLDAFRALAEGLTPDLVSAACHWIETYNSRGHVAQLDRLQQLEAGASWWQRLRHGPALAFLRDAIQRERAGIAAHDQVLAEHARRTSPRLLANLRDFDLTRAPGGGDRPPLDDAQRQALADYMAPNGKDDPGGSTAINSALRRQQVLTYPTYVAAHRLLSALAALRPVDLASHGRDLQVWRGASHLPGGIADPAQRQVGDEVMDPAIVSCTRSRPGILDGDFLIRIDRPRHGRDIAGYGQHDTNAMESELVFPPAPAFATSGATTRAAPTSSPRICEGLCGTARRLPRRRHSAAPQGGHHAPENIELRGPPGTPPGGAAGPADRRPAAGGRAAGPLFQLRQGPQGRLPHQPGPDPGGPGRAALRLHRPRTE